jgi:hypothetical protein
MMFTKFRCTELVSWYCLPLGIHPRLLLMVWLITLSSTLMIVFPASRNSMYFAAAYYRWSFAFTELCRLLSFFIFLKETSSSLWRYLLMVLLLTYSWPFVLTACWISET